MLLVESIEVELRWCPAYELYIFDDPTWFMQLSDESKQDFTFW